MQKLSQVIVIIITLFIFTNNSCKKETPYMNDAIITGFDERYCICCGGLMITFNGETKPYTGDFKLIDESAGATIGITINSSFPVYVKVDWKADTTKGCNHIIVTRIAKR